MILIENLERFHSLMNNKSRESTFSETFSKFLVDLFSKATLGDSIILHELSLGKIKIFLDFEPYNIITSIILPQVMKIYSTTTSLKVKNLCVNSFFIMIEEMGDKNIDNVIIIEKLLPLIQNTSQSNYTTNGKFLLNVLKLYDSMFNKFQQSMNKSYQIGSTQMDSIDLKMNLMFEIWKLAKFAKLDTDLEKFYLVLTKIESDTKQELNKGITSDKSGSASVATSPTTIKPVRAKQLPQQQPVSLTPMTISNPSTKEIPKRKQLPKVSPYDSSVPIMKPKIQPINLTKPTQTPSIDWSKSSTTTSLPIKKPMNVMKPTAGTSYSVMTPKPRNASPAPSSAMSTPTAKTVTPGPAEDDEWDSFQSSPSVSIKPVVKIPSNDDKWDSLI